MTNELIPASHLDLLTEPVNAVLTTMMPDGQPQSSMVWADYDGHHILINTARERQKTQNLQKNPKTTLLIIDPADSSRWIEIRGRCVEMTESGAITHADKLAKLYSGGEKQRFYGDIYTEEKRLQETRVIVRILPVKIATDAIFR